MQDEAMRPCPFCGSDLIDVFPPTCTRKSPYDAMDRAFPIARCSGCFATVQGSNWDSSGNSARAMWNQRTDREGE